MVVASFLEGVGMVCDRQTGMDDPIRCSSLTLVREEHEEFGVTMRQRPNGQPLSIDFTGKAGHTPFVTALVDEIREACFKT